MPSSLAAIKNERFAVDPRQPAYLHPGGSTAVGSNVEYRLGKLKETGVLKGVWLDYGCADGGYTAALTRYGAEKAVGVDPDRDRIEMAKAKGASDTVSFAWYDGQELPFEAESFNGVFLNEVLEHVLDEPATLAEIRRVLRPGGHLAVMSPNRWFPFEGHGMRVMGRDLGFPIPFLPWLPSRLAMRFMSARNYWPYELRNVVARSGLEIVSVSYVLPVFEVYPWLPQGLIRLYRRLMPVIERAPGLRKFGVSTFVLARRPV
ncbi:class I SAM-dependent methyltransferase [Methylobacterium nodulans]|uniref:Methyltransferase type 11 n=1 Tax=Methylobacterium nodulans (strain LMG 21967 / CNCM I-2342 / ORS 2060) TaxID=460265 RepID=B8IHF6_METNO|nr:class I SAM-dependent methyltransferase [Methylobacterium nodulans]ACL61619.1 Methyltransferase type 11 [Methylobacterium nodulans ORS 2060]